MAKVLHHTVLYFFFLILGFPLFYFVYKYGDPEPLAHDFFQYYRLYFNWDIGNVNAPFNMRLAGASLVHLFYELGFSYDTVIVFDKYASWGFLKSVFFCAVFFNYLCVAATCLQLYITIKKHVGGFLISLFGGVLYLLGFGTVFYELMPLTDAFSVLLFAIGFHLYLNKSYWVMAPIMVLIFQREYLLMALGLMAFMDLIKNREKRFYFTMLIAATISFLIYYVLRKTVFYTPALDHQASTGFLMDTFMQFKLPDFDFIKQTAMTMNLFFIYLAVVFYKRFKGLETDKYNLLIVFLIFLQLTIICLAAGHGNNMGRYFYLIVPYVIFQLIKEVKALAVFSA